MNKNVHDKFDERLVEMFNSGNIDMDYIDTNLNKFIASRLHDYQFYHVYNMISCIKNNNVSVDSSMTGTGKTYTSLAAIKHLNLEPLIICPKNSVSMWKNVCNYFQVEPIAIVNIELIKNGGTYDSKFNKKKSTFLSVTEEGNFMWNFKKQGNTIVIFDEAHKCKNYKSGNGQLLLSLKNVCKILLLSATLCDNPYGFTVFGYMLDFYNNIRRGSKWIKTLVEEQERTGNNNLIHKYIFPSKGSCMTMNDIPDKYPLNQISAECYDTDPKCIAQINKMYTAMNTRLKDKKADGDTLVSMLRERQIIENHKVPLIIDLVNKYLEHNKSVVIFVNFVPTLDKLREYFDDCNMKYSYVCGKQTSFEVAKNIEMFQNNTNRIIILTAKSGSSSISLHDTDGKYPRVSIIIPTYSSIDLIQTLGRICRKGQKSPTLQILLYCAGTQEENISKAVKNKIKFIDRLTNHDLAGL